MADTHDRVFFELLKKLSLVSGCLLVSYTPLARFVVAFAERRRERPSYRLETVLVLGINASATVDAEVL